jgi:putative lipoprotein
MGSAQLVLANPRLLLSLITLALAACSTGSTPSQATVSGTATYRERMALPPQAAFEATLEDVSKVDAASEVIGRTRIEGPGQPPIAFRIPYDPARINAQHRYVVRARILRGEELMFTTDTQYPVLGPGQVDHVELVLRRVASTASTAPVPASSSPENSEWTLVRLGERAVTRSDKQRPPNLMMSSGQKRVSGFGGCNRFTGSYTLQGDQLKFGQLAGTMMACVEGMDQEQAFYKALGSASAWRITEQQLELLDASGKSLATFSSEQPEKSELGGTSWQLVQFQGGDDKTLTPDDKTKYTITFNADGTLAAHIDCNRGRGSWKSSAPGQVEFGPMALTRAVCPPGSLHDQIIKQWPYVKSYVMKDGHLFLSLMADGGIYEFEPTTATN